VAVTRIGSPFLLISTLFAVLLYIAHLMWMIGTGSPAEVEPTHEYALVFLVAAVCLFAILMLRSRLHKPLGQVTVRSMLFSPVAACLAGAVAITATSLVTYRLGGEIVARSTEHRLQEVATLKASMVKNWLNDVQDDLQLATSSPGFVKSMDDWRAAGDQDMVAKQRFLDELVRLSQVEHFAEVSIHDPITGALLLTISGTPDTPEVRHAAIAAMKAKSPTLEEFHTVSNDGAKRPLRYLGFFSAVSTNASRTLVIHVVIDPKIKLFPLIEQWPGASKSAEVLLMRREGDSIVALNGRTVEAAASSAQNSLTNSFASSLARDGAGAMHGLDMHHVPVLAYAVAVPETSWFVVTKLDQAEVDAEPNRVALLAASIIVGLLLLGAWWWVEYSRRALVEQTYQRAQAEQVERVAELSGRVVLVQEEERRRWSGELHDRIGANLAVINLNLKEIQRSNPTSDPEEEAIFSETSALVIETVASIREFCTVLRPATLDYAGLVPAMEAGVEQFQRRSGAKVELNHADFSGRCTPELETVLYRIFQEAMLNCFKHASAKSVKVRLEGSPSRLSLTVEDDGVGFDPAQLNPSSGSHGLLSMRDRAAFSGAHLEITSRIGAGTRVRFSLT
jgi:signal transduction histidine kinase